MFYTRLIEVCDKHKQLFMAKEVFKKEQDIPQLAGQVI